MIEINRDQDYWDFVFDVEPGDIWHYGWDSNLPGANWRNSEEASMGGQEEAQTDTSETEDLVLNLVNEPTFARKYGYYVYYRFKRIVPNQQFTITTDSELKEWYLDVPPFGQYDIIGMTEQEEWS